MATGDWRKPERIAESGWGSVALAVDAVGNAHVVVGHDEEGIHYLTNETGEWASRVVAEAPAGGAVTEPVVAVDEDGAVYVAFVRWSAWNPCYFECPPEPTVVDGLFYVTNANGEWSDLVRVPTEVEPGDYLGVPQLDVRNSRVHLVYERWADDSDAQPIWYATSLAGQWTTEQLDEDAWHPTLDLTTDGTAVVAFSQGSESGEEMLISRAAERTGSFSSELVPGTAGALWPLFALDGQDQPHIVFSDDDYRIWYTYLRDGSWMSPEIPAPNIANDAAVDLHAVLHLIFDVYGAGRSRNGLWYASNRGGQFDVLRIDTSTRAVVDAPSPPSALALDSSGRPHVVFGRTFDDDRNGFWYTVGPGYEGD